MSANQPSRPFAAVVANGNCGCTSGYMMFARIVLSGRQIDPQIRIYVVQTHPSGTRSTCRLGRTGTPRSPTASGCSRLIISHSRRNDFGDRLLGGRGGLNSASRGEPPNGSRTSTASIVVPGGRWALILCQVCRCATARAVGSIIALLRLRRKRGRNQGARQESWRHSWIIAGRIVSNQQHRRMPRRYRRS
jgi:hypothetical protein